MQAAKNSEAEFIIAQNQEEWSRLLFLLKDPEPNVLWINCDTSRLKKPMHDALTQHLSEFKPYDIYIDEKTDSVNRIILGTEKDKISANSIIHIFGIEDAVKNTEFLGNLNFQRDSLFRKTPSHIIFWADFATGTVLTHKAYDFWSWVVFTFDFTTPNELLTSRQKGFGQELILESTTILLPNKDSQARIRHLEDEWEEFLRSVNGKPSTAKQMKDAVTIGRALANEYRDEGKHRSVVHVLQNILQLNTSLIRANDTITIYNELCIALRALGEYSSAREFGELALKEGTKEYGEDNPEIAAFQANLALVYLSLGEFSEAKGLMEKALNNGIKYFGEYHPNVASCQSNLASIYQSLGDLVKAKELFEKALDSDMRNFGEYHPAITIDQSNLALLYQNLGNLSKAKDLMEKVLEGGVKNFGVNHPDVAIWNTNLAMLHHALGDLNKARALMEIAIDNSIDNFGNCHPNVAIMYGNLACIYIDLELPEKANESMQHAYEIRKKTLGEDHPKTRLTKDALQNLNNNEPRQTM